MKSKAQIAAQKRNWSKRIITGHTYALKSTLKDGGLTDKEQNKIKEVVDICMSLLSEWPKRIE